MSFVPFWYLTPSLPHSGPPLCFPRCCNLHLESNPLGIPPQLPWRHADGLGKSCRLQLPDVVADVDRAGRQRWIRTDTEVRDINRYQFYSADSQPAGACQLAPPAGWLQNNRYGGLSDDCSCENISAVSLKRY